MKWFIFKESEGGRNTNLSASSNKNENSRWTETRNEKNCSLCKIEHSSTDLQTGLQMSSNSLCHDLVLKSHKVVEIQI